MNMIEHVSSWEDSIGSFGSDISALYVTQKVNTSLQPSGYRGLFLQVWSVGREGGPPRPFSWEVKNSWRCISMTTYVLVQWC